MAQAELNVSIDKMSGKIYGDSDIYITHRHGKTVISHYPKHRDPSKITPHQHDLNNSFGGVSKQAKQRNLPIPLVMPIGSSVTMNTKPISNPPTNTTSPYVVSS